MERERERNASLSFSPFAHKIAKTVILFDFLGYRSIFEYLDASVMVDVCVLEFSVGMKRADSLC